MDEKEFIIISEEKDPQRTFLLENFCGCSEMILNGDEYSKIHVEIRGFMNALDHLKINYNIREFICEDFGNLRFSIEKKYFTEPQGENPNLDSFYLKNKLRVIELREIF